MNLSAEEIAKATGSSLANAEKFRPYLNKYMEKYGINTPNRILAFLSQLGTESGGLQYTLEIASGTAYEGRTDLGNIYAGDGKKFKGRGLIQLTGRSNYSSMSQKVGKDLVTNPELVEQPELATQVSAVFWADKTRKGLTLNQWADKFDLTQPIDSTTNWDIHENITRAINGGTNGINDRASRLSSGAQIFEQIKKKASSVSKSFTSLKDKWWLIPSLLVIFGSLTAVGIWYYRKKH
jgi:putative chitinase